MKEERLVGACGLEVSDMEPWCSCFMARGEGRTSWKDAFDGADWSPLGCF